MAKVTLSSPVVVTGSSYTEDDALSWLKVNGAQVEWFKGVTVISLPTNTKVEEPPYQSTEGAITFYGQCDDDETYVAVYVRMNSQDTELHFYPDDKFTFLLQWAKEHHSVDAPRPDNPIPGVPVVEKISPMIKVVSLDFDDSSDTWSSEIELHYEEYLKIPVQKIPVQFTYGAKSFELVA